MQQTHSTAHHISVQHSAGRCTALPAACGQHEAESKEGHRGSPVMGGAWAGAASCIAIGLPAAQLQMAEISSLALGPALHLALAPLLLLPPRSGLAVPHQSHAPPAASAPVLLAGPAAARHQPAGSPKLHHHRRRCLHRYHCHSHPAGRPSHPRHCHYCWPPGRLARPPRLTRALQLSRACRCRWRQCAGAWPRKRTTCWRPRLLSCALPHLALALALAFGAPSLQVAP